MIGAELIVEILKNHDVEQVSVLCGNGLNDFMQACIDEDVEIIDCRNEQAAAYIAEAYGSMTGKLGVCAVSAGPGHTNALTGLANAWWDGRPMLLLTGCSEAQTRGMGHFQELDQVEMSKPACKYARLIERPEQLEFEVNKAIQIALSGRPGPVQLSVTGDVMSAEVGTPTSTTTRGHLRKVTPCARPDAELLSKAADIIDNAENPVFVAGSGCFYSGAGPQMQAFAAAADMPIFSLMWNRGCIDSHWPQYVGPSSAECNGAFPLISKADVIVTLGGRVDFRLGYGKPPACADDAMFIRVDVEPAEMAKGPADMSIMADPKSFLTALMEELPEPKKHTAWLDELLGARSAFVRKWDERLCELETPVPALCVIRAIKPFLDRDVSFLLDGGNIGRWAHMILWDRHPSFWQTCGTSGVVGWGIPGAIAAKKARPDHPVLLLSGDGSAGFTLGDIETALRHKTPYVAVIASDCAWGIVAEEFAEQCRSGSALGNIRFDKVAEAMGARGVFIENGARLSPAIDEALGMDTVTFIHVPIQLGGINYWDTRLCR